MPRDLFSPLGEKETFSQLDFWRRFERGILLELSAVHASGARGVKCANGVSEKEFPQPGYGLPGWQLTDMLRDIAARTSSRWVAWLADNRMYLVHGPNVELESVLLDGAWYHSWHQRST